MPMAGDFHPVIRFAYEGGNRAERRYPFRVPWRKLPGGLIERPDGGGWILELEGRPAMTVHSGEVLVVPRGVLHRLRMTGAKIMKTTWMMADFDSLTGMDILAASKVPLILPASAGAKLVRLMAKLRELNMAIAQGDLVALARCQAVGFHVLDILLQYAEVRQTAPPDPYLRRLLPVVYHVEACLDKPISINELARQACLSPSRFHSVFKRLFGVAPMNYVMNSRIRLAQRLLISSSRPINEVAALAGFASPYYFSRAFRRHLKTTPTAFRQDPSWSTAPVVRSGRRDAPIKGPRACA